MVGRDVFRQDGVVPAEGHLHLCLAGLPAPARALDVREQEGDHTRRQPDHDWVDYATVPDRRSAAQNRSDSDPAVAGLRLRNRCPQVEAAMRRSWL
jgi:hypothetical protein